jgi:hypothetical protein
VTKKVLGEFETYSHVKAVSCLERMISSYLAVYTSEGRRLTDINLEAPRSVSKQTSELKGSTDLHCAMHDMNHTKDISRSRQRASSGRISTCHCSRTDLYGGQFEDVVVERICTACNKLVESFSKFAVVHQDR